MLPTLLLVLGCAAPELTLSLALDATHPTAVLATAVSSQPVTACQAVWTGSDGEHAVPATADGCAWTATLLGIPADTDVTVTLRCDEATSDPASITTAATPEGVEPLEVVQRAEGIDERYILNAGFTLDGTTPGYIAIHDLDGRVVWWIPSPTGPSFSAHLDPEAGVVYALEGDGLVLAPLAGPDVRWTVPQGHHDTLALGGGQYLVTTYETREVDGDRVQGDALVRVDGATGAMTTVWSAFDALPVVPNGGWSARTPDGAADWTHVNGLALDAEAGLVYVSLYWDHAVLALDADTFSLVAAIGGPDSDHTVDVPFGPQHSPVVRDGALWLFDNGSNAAVGSTVAAYTLDGATATRSWAWSPDPAHLDIVLGSVDPADDAILTSWGDTAQVQVLAPDGGLVGDYALGSGFLAGAARFVEM